MKVLVVVDMQYDFVYGALGSDEARAIVPNVKEKIEKCAADSSYAIVYTRDTHFNDYLDTNEGKHLPVPHCKVNTLGWLVLDNVFGASEGATHVDVFNKYTFGMEDIATMLETIPSLVEGWENEVIESIELIGVCTDICVVSNALLLKTTFTETPIIVDSSCCAGVTPAKHEAALEVMRSCQIEVI